jgi:hypothetical protein
MSRSPSLLASLATSLLVCAGPASAPPVDLPLEPTRLYLLCDWDPRAPRLARVTVDLYLRSPAAGDTGGAAAGARAVVKSGGHVVHRFALPILRVVLDTGAVRRLVRGPGAVAYYAATVTDPTDHRIETRVFYGRPVTAADERTLVALGGEQVGAAPIPMLLTVLPDSVIPQVARLPGVAYIKAGGVGCM